MNDEEFSPTEPELNPLPAPEAAAQPAPVGDESGLLFQSFMQPEIVLPKRTPHLGHLLLFGAFVIFGVLCMTVSVLIAVFIQFHDLAKVDRIKTDVGYILGSEAIIYLVTLALSFIVFPLFWNKSFLAGVQWRGATALKHRWKLIIVAMGCICLAFLDDKFMPGPSNAPIDEMFRTSRAAWLMFAFGVTLAPFFEEIAFRGFLLPALATAWDWVVEKGTGRAEPALDPNGHPQWSISAMVAASIVTSLPFALMHADQTGWSLGPFVLLASVSLILCAVRLKTRSVASSTLVHACYNFILFSFAMISSGGFRHLDKV